MTTTFEVNRENRAATRSVDETAELDDGQVLARIDHFALTSNNITYSMIGHMMGYWDFFPPADEGWGRVPAFGHAEIVESRCDGVEVGTRVYGYLPMASHVVFEPGRINTHSFHDMAAHRQAMSGVYNRYEITAVDPLHDPDREEQRVLLHPLLTTSFVIDDWLGDNDLFAATTVVLSSASSKTAIGVAHLMSMREGVHVVGLTSPGNVDFTTSLGCYDQVVTYADVGTLDDRPAVYMRPLVRTCRGLPTRRPTKEIAATFVASGQGLTDVNTPSQRAEPATRTESIMTLPGSLAPGSARTR